MCMSFIFYLAACGPKGHGSGLPLPSRTAAFFTSPYMTVSCPQLLWVILGQPFLLLPTPPTLFPLFLFLLSLVPLPHSLLE